MAPITTFSHSTGKLELVLRNGVQWLEVGFEQGDREVINHLADKTRRRKLIVQHLFPTSV